MCAPTQSHQRLYRLSRPLLAVLPWDSMHRSLIPSLCPVSVVFSLIHLVSDLIVTLVPIFEPSFQNGQLLSSLLEKQRGEVGYRMKQNDGAIGSMVDNNLHQLLIFRCLMTQFVSPPKADASKLLGDARSVTLSMGNCVNVLL